MKKLVSIILCVLMLALSIFGIFAIVALLRDNREDAVIGGFFTAGILLVGFLFNALF